MFIITEPYFLVFKPVQLDQKTSNIAYNFIRLFLFTGIKTVRKIRIKKSRYK